jgi:hypothetical protein
MQERTVPLPSVIDAYIHAAMKRASFERIDGIVAATVPGAFGVMAFGDTKQACLGDLRSRLEEWVVASLAECIALPTFGGISFSEADKLAIAAHLSCPPKVTDRESFQNEEEFLAALARWDEEDQSL